MKPFEQMLGEGILLPSWLLLPEITPLFPATSLPFEPSMLNCVNHSTCFSSASPVQLALSLKSLLPGIPLFSQNFSILLSLFLPSSPMVSVTFSWQWAQRKILGVHAPKREKRSNARKNKLNAFCYMEL